MEVLCIHQQLTRYVVTNKGKIIIITYNRKYAEYLARLIEQNNFDRSYSLVIG